MKKKCKTHKIVNHVADEAFRGLGRKSNAFFLRLENIESPISGIVRAANLIKLHLVGFSLAKSERNVLLKQLSTNEALKSFFSDIEFEVEELVSYWSGEFDPRSDLNWEKIRIRSSELTWSLRGFVRERVSMIVGYVESSRWAKMIPAILERSTRPEEFCWNKSSIDIFGSMTPGFFYKVYPRAQLKLPSK